MTKRAKQLTKRERKAAAGGARAPSPNVDADQLQHIHCVACGRHLDRSEFEAPMSAKMLRCKHGGAFPSCLTCETQSVALLAEHDRTGEAVRTASAWH
jgi:phage FluMu protein Com